MSPERILSKIARDTPLTEAEIYSVVHGISTGTVSDAQVGAFAMGVCCRALSNAQRVQLTAAMRESGAQLHWDVPGPVLDKHSTGGVGDCVSLVLAPALAACGAYVPMISGRGLGHTGGTLDKLEAIPGLRVALTLQEIEEQVSKIGCAISSATAEIAPADQRLYAIRSETGTVESLDLITASILSKKLSEGIEALVLDVKIGPGSFMATPEAARALAEALVQTAQGAGVMTSAFLTDMSQPVVNAAGNAVEVIEAMRVLTGDKTAAHRLRALVETLGGEALALGGMAADAADGAARITAALEGGFAADVFGKMIAAQGGPTDFLELWRDRLPAAPVVLEVQVERPGVVAAIDTRALGETVIDLGGGRRKAADRLHPGVGLTHLAEIGQSLVAGQMLARIHAADESAARQAADAVFQAYSFAAKPVTPPPLIGERLG